MRRRLLQDDPPDIATARDAMQQAALQARRAADVDLAVDLDLDIDAKAEELLAEIAGFKKGLRSEIVVRVGDTIVSAIDDKPTPDKLAATLALTLADPIARRRGRE